MIGLLARLHSNLSRVIRALRFAAVSRAPTFRRATQFFYFRSTIRGRGCFRNYSLSTHSIFLSAYLIGFHRLWYILNQASSFLSSLLTITNLCAITHHCLAPDSEFCVRCGWQFRPSSLSCYKQNIQIFQKFKDAKRFPLCRKNLASHLSGTPMADQAVMSDI